jgi:predicted RNase H-like HicB family nuclease
VSGNEEGDDGWIVASVPEVSGALSQGGTREEARSNVIDVLRGILELRFGEHALTDTAQDSEQLELVIAESRPSLWRSACSATSVSVGVSAETSAPAARAAIVGRQSGQG